MRWATLEEKLSAVRETAKYLAKPVFAPSNSKPSRLVLNTSYSAPSSGYFETSSACTEAWALQRLFMAKFGRERTKRCLRFGDYTWTQQVGPYDSPESSDAWVMFDYCHEDSELRAGRKMPAVDSPAVAKAMRESLFTRRDEED